MSVYVRLSDVSWIGSVELLRSRGERFMERSRIPNFHKLTVSERVRAIHERGFIDEDDYRLLAVGKHTLRLHHADKMIENVIGVMGLPVGLGLNFLVNRRDYVVPLVVEEPSIVAALCSAAKLVRAAGGFRSVATDPILIGQVQILDVPHPAEARANLLQRKAEILALANSIHPKMLARGGGARDIEVHSHVAPSTGRDMLVLHLLVDTRDAMGANLVNTMCEGVATLVESITGGRVLLRILSNLSDRALVTATCAIPSHLLSTKAYDGEEVCDGIVQATDLAEVDPYRATTHNKGIMNGIDAVALATGNDWRAIEAAAHAYAARDGRYRSLTRWTRNERGELVGQITIPLKVGTVGGPLQSNPTVAVNLRMMGIQSATELAEVMGAVGLAQNFSALRALVTDGIQRGHMTLHARSVAVAAGATPDVFEAVVEQLIESGEIKIWKAQEILQGLRSQHHEKGSMHTESNDGPWGIGHGKIILLGEHAVVYKRRALSAPVPLAIRTRIRPAEEGVHLIVPRWSLEQRVRRRPDNPDTFQNSILMLLEKLGIQNEPMRIEVYPQVPRAMGLGGSAAMAVSIVRALNLYYKLGLDDERVNELAYACEQNAHGTASGIDNTVATYGRFLLYDPKTRPEKTFLKPAVDLTFVVALSRVESLTAKMVARVRASWEKHPALYERIFDEIDHLTEEGLAAVRDGDLVKLGELMNLCHGLLTSLRVSSWELEELVQIARENGALGAKLTGGGGGGAVIALCQGNSERIVRAMHDAGYQAFEVSVRAS
jgi:hydroxymethylglutaryl-CoA reductase